MTINTNILNIDAALGVVELFGVSVGATLDFNLYPIKDTDYNIVSGSGALVAPVAFTDSAPEEGRRYTFIYKANVSLAGSSINFFGTSLTASQAASELYIDAVYENAAWSVVVSQDVNSSQWVSTSMIQDLAVTTNKLDNLAVTTGKINNSAVTHAKYQNIADNRILGNVSGVSAAPSELTPAQVNSLIGSVVQAGASPNSITTTAFNGNTSGVGGVNLGDALCNSGAHSLVAGRLVSSIGQYNAGFGSTVSISGDASFAAGQSLTVSGTSSACFGSDNVVSGNNSHSSGDQNVSSGNTSFSHGQLCVASGDYSVATGRSSVSSRFAQKSHASGSTASGGYAQETLITAGVSTLDATVTNLYLDGLSERITIPSNTIAFFEGTLVAVQYAGVAGVVGDNASWKFNGTISNVSGVTTLVDNVLWQDGTGAWGAVAQRSQVANAATWVMTCTADNVNDAIDITVTGQVNKSIHWHCVLKLNEIKYL